jgi:hypothetical protein
MTQVLKEFIEYLPHESNYPELKEKRMSEVITDYLSSLP